MKLGHVFADSVFYDASAWTMARAYEMPFAPNASIKTVDQVTEVSTSSFDFPTEKAYAYLIDWSDYYAPKMLFDLQEAGVHVEMINRPFST